MIELLLYISKVSDLNDNLALFHSLAENDLYSFRLVYNENLEMLYANKKIRGFYSCKDGGTLECILNDKIQKFILSRDIMNELKKNSYWRKTIRDEDEKTIDCYLQLLEDDKISITFVDISEEVNSQIEVKRLKIYDKEKTEFIANISHELKTPLNLLYSCIQLLDNFVDKSSVDFRSMYNKHKNVLHINCERMTRLINNIMDLAKMDTGLLYAKFQNYNIVEIVEEVTLSVAQFALLKKIRVIFDTNEEECIIKCDASMIERAMLNLLSNAIKFSRENTSIFVNVEVDSKDVRIEVKDEGIGISKENKNIIFDKFIQVDKSFTRQSEGSGIGLSLVKSIVDAHESEIFVKSDINEGSTFVIVLPNKPMNDYEVSIYKNGDYNTRIELSDIYCY